MKHLPWTTIAAVAFPLAVFFGPALFADRTFALRDAGHFYHPLFEWCCGEWAAGRVPLWNPLENGGVPALADASSSVCYPGKLLFLLPVSFTLRYKLYVVLHVVLAAVASYVLSRAWGAGRHAAAIAALSYAFGGCVVFQYCNVVFLVGAAWLPFAALAAERMLQRRDWRVAVLLGLILAMMVLGGDPQAAYHALLMTALFAMFITPPDATSEVAAGLPALSATSPSGIRRRLLQIIAGLGLAALAAVVGLALSAVQVLPSQEAVKYSERAAFDEPRSLPEIVQMRQVGPPAGQSFGQAAATGLFHTPRPGTHHALAYDFSIGPWRLAEFFFPNVSGRMFPTHRRWLSQFPAEGRVWTPTLYLGLLPLMLALWCFTLRRGAGRRQWLSWLVLVATLGSFGWYGGGWLVREVWGVLGGRDFDLAPPVGGVYWLLVTLLPEYAYFRYPAKLLVVVALGISQLAAMGWDRLLEQPRPRFARVLQIFGTASGGAALAAWWFVPAIFARLRHVDAALGPFDAAGASRDVVCALAHAAIVAVISAWLLTRTWSGSLNAERWRTAALLFCAMEITVANQWLLPTAPAAIWRSESSIARVLRQSRMTDRDEDRLSQPPPRVYRDRLAGWRPSRFRNESSRERLTEVVRWERETLFPKHQLPHRIALVESYGSLKLVDYESLMRVARQHGSRQPHGVLPQPTPLRLLGTEFLVLPEANSPAFAQRLASEPPPVEWPENAALWKMQSTLPRAWVVHDVEWMPPLAFPHRLAAVDERTRNVLFPGLRARDFSRMAVVEADRRSIDAAPAPFAAFAASDSAQGTEESCRIVHYEPQLVVIEAELTRPGLVVLSDTYYPGWKAIVTTRVTGGTASSNEPRELPILRTNRVFRGVWLPVGRHRIEYRFQPTTFYRGAWISGLSWLVLGGWAIAWLWQRRLRSRKQGGVAQH